MGKLSLSSKKPNPYIRRQSARKTHLDPADRIEALDMSRSEFHAEAALASRLRRSAGIAINWVGKG